MGANDGGVDHAVLVVRIPRQSLKNTLPYAALAPARVAGMHSTKVAKALRQVPPRNTCAVALEHGIHEQTVVTRSRSRLASLAGQQVLGALPVRIAQGISSGHAKSYRF